MEIIFTLRINTHRQRLDSKVKTKMRFQGEKHSQSNLRFSCWYNLSCSSTSTSSREKAWKMGGEGDRRDAAWDDASCCDIGHQFAAPPFEQSLPSTRHKLYRNMWNTPWPDFGTVVFDDTGLVFLCSFYLYCQQDLKCVLFFLRDYI